jgi:hypothetical protein
MTTWPAAKAACAHGPAAQHRRRTRVTPRVQVPDSLRAMVAHAEGDRAEALTARLPHLYALANALDANTADDLVRETLTSALADPDADTTGHGLAAAAVS